MRTSLLFFRITFVSVEFTLTLAGLLALRFGIGHVRTWIDHIKFDGEVIRWLALGPLALTVFIFRESRSLILPANHRTDLHQWPQYEELKICGHVARGYAIIFTSMGLAMWIYRAEPAVQLIVFATALIGAAADYYSVYLAEIRVNELLSARNHLPPR